MKNFDWSQFTRKIAIQAPKQKLYDAWTKPNELERWFLSNAEFYTSEKEKINKTESIKEGQSYDWQWFLYPVTETGKVTKANGSDFLQFTFAGNCLVDVNFKTFKNGTIVSLTQKNIPTDDENKMNVRLGCDKGWSFYLVNLKSVYEGGLDLRNKDPELKPMLNN